jgi:uncharacterized protein (DUF433 family)
MAPKHIGRFIVTDPAVCHGKPTFSGTRILVSDILEQIADGMDWESIIEEWHGSISREAISEALRLAREALVRHSPKLELKPVRP